MALADADGERWRIPREGAARRHANCVRSCAKAFSPRGVVRIVPVGCGEGYGVCGVSAASGRHQRGGSIPRRLKTA